MIFNSPKFSQIDGGIKRYVWENFQKGTFMDIRLDWSFKFVFRKKENLIPFLSVLLGEQIIDLEYEDSILLQEEAEDKTVLFDILCTFQDGRKAIVEMQNSWRDDMPERLCYYGACLLKKSISKGVKVYNKTRPIYVICISNFRFGVNAVAPEDKFLYRYSIREEENGYLFSNQLHFIVLELPKMRKIDVANMSPVEIYAYLFVKMSTFAEKPDVPSGYEGLLESAKLSKVSKIEDLENYLQAMIERESSELYFEHGRLFGEREGMEKKALRIAQELLSEGLSDELILRVTGITPQELSDLKARVEKSS